MSDKYQELAGPLQGGDNNQGRFPIAEDSGYPNKYDSVDIFKFWSFVFTFIDIKLLSEHKIFKNQVLVRLE